jgi:hypothetical protein
VNLVQVQGLTCKAEDIDVVLNLIVSAYLLFDPKGLGHIDRNSVTQMISESKGKKNAMLSESRWSEMVSQLLSSFIESFRIGMLMEALIFQSLSKLSQLGSIWRKIRTIFFFQYLGVHVNNSEIRMI